MHTQAISAEQARQNMQSRCDSPSQAIESINQAIHEASELHRGDTTVFLSRAHIDADDLARILQHFQSRGFRIEDRCHNREAFAVKVAWYPASGRL